jgi:DNA-binding CsgD family transcriptional regulator
VRPTGLDGDPPPDTRACIHRLWDELADFGLADVDGALNHLLGAISSLVQADTASWLGAVRLLHDDTDPMLGWRPRATRYLHTTPQDAAFNSRAMKDLQKGYLDESVLAHVRQAGTFRAHVIRELVTPAWFESSWYEYGYEARGYVDALMVVFPLQDSTEAYYGFLRKDPPGLFAEEQRRIAAYAIRGLKWFHLRVMLSHGLPVASDPLTPSERRVAGLLMTDLTEKQIAARLDLTPATTHKYISDIFRKFGVSGRPGLTALWMGGGSPRRAGTPPD